nr:PRD domain-containing protein [uncultured Clostridium sp.]
MVIYKIFNNNAVVVKDENGLEKILMGCALGFKKKCGDVIDENKVDKVFVLSDPDVNNKFQEMMTYIPAEYVEFGERVIRYAANALNKPFNDTIYISLINHIYTAVFQHQKGIFINNGILWDIKRFYKEEYKIGLIVLDMIEERFSFRLPEDEAGFIAIHLVEASMNENSKEMHKTTEIMSAILNIIQYHFHVPLNEDSINYCRFITHLKFFAQRLVEGKTYTNDKQDDLLETLKVKYTNSYKCVNKIGSYILSEYNYLISNDEKLYLTIHIQQVIYKSIL